MSAGPGSDPCCSPNSRSSTRVRAVPTRRVSLGNLVLPTDPPPGFGGLLLGAVVARHIGGVDADMHDDVRRLIARDRARSAGRPAATPPPVPGRPPRPRSQPAPDARRGRRDRVRLRDPRQRSRAWCSVPSMPPSGSTVAHRRIDHTGAHQGAHAGAVRSGPALVAYLAGSNSTALSALADPRGGRWSCSASSSTIRRRRSARSPSSTVVACATCIPTTAARPSTPARRSSTSTKRVGSCRPSGEMTVISDG